MSYRCVTVLRSRGPQNILSTLEITYPRFVHSEVLTHRDRERNSGSSRAIPWPVMCERIEQDPVMPIEWGTEQKGMVTGPALTEPDLIALADKIWLQARTSAVIHADMIHNIGHTYNLEMLRAGLPQRPEWEDIKIHKSLPNRVTEPWMWITVVMTATEWNNLFRQRCHPDAEVHFQKIANMMRAEIDRTDNIQDLKAGEWHLPYFDAFERKDIANAIPAKLPYMAGDIPTHIQAQTILEYSKRISVARCARVSFVQHGAKNRDVVTDAGLWERLRIGSGLGHWSPFGHVAEASDQPVRSGPFIGFKQFRKEFAAENTPG